MDGAAHSSQLTGSRSRGSSKGVTEDKVVDASRVIDCSSSGRAYRWLFWEGTSDEVGGWCLVPSVVDDTDTAAGCTTRIPSLAAGAAERHVDQG